MEKKTYWLHSYTISGGKNPKLFQILHEDEAKANENLILMGGVLNRLQEV